jgi:hypothetical protein
MDKTLLLFLLLLSEALTKQAQAKMTLVLYKA